MFTSCTAGRYLSLHYKIIIIPKTLYLIPTIISEHSLSSINSDTINAIHRLSHFVVERARTARRYIKSTNPPYQISELTIVEIDKNGSEHIPELESLFKSSKDIGLISESGMPAVADPGSDIVMLAHKVGYNVRPLAGPSSIILSLAASGLNGNAFAFHGYLPIKDNELRKKLQQLESDIQKKDQTQIFIETPYRNNRLLKNLLNSIRNKNILLCIASDISGKNENIKTKSLRKWANLEELPKVPTIFLLGR